MRPEREQGLKEILQAPNTGEKLGLGSLGTVGCAIALTLAGILAGVLAAALTLAVILALAGVLGGVGGGLREENAGRNGGGCGGRLRIHTNGGATEEAGNCSGQSKRLCGVLHERNLSMGWAAHDVHRTLIKKRKKLPY
jgi:hypothetical protein